jgi:aminopeptidase N
MTVRRFFIVAAALAAVAVVALMSWRRFGETPVIEPGVPLALAEARAGAVSELKYALSLTVPAGREQPVTGKVTVTFALAKRPDPLAFDFAQPPDRLLSTIVNGDPYTAAPQNGHIVLPAGRLKRGQNVVEFTFVSGNEALNRNDEFLYSLFVPARASLAFPCFDQPNLKARWTLMLDVPAEWVAVSNGRESGRVTRDGRSSLVFDETEPLPPYLFAFAAGKFAIETAQREGRTMRLFHRETDPGRIARNRDAVFDQHARALSWMRDYTGIDYAFGKFDFVAIPAFQFSGMEHPGAIYYNANSILLDASATQAQELARANTIAHETAHMWFGDLVTMPWFNDVWMKEVFANFLAAKMVNPFFPQVNHDLRFLVQHYPGAYDVDRTDGANPIRQPLANLDEAGSLYGPIIYLKAPIVMRQLERMIGEETFRTGAREYLSAHRFGNAGWPELIRILDERTPVDLAAWSHAWVEEAGRPVIRTELQEADGVIDRLAYVQSDPRGRSIQWPQQIQVLVGTSAGVQPFDVSLSGPATELPGAKGLKADWVLPVGLGLGYGSFELDERTTAYLTTSLHALPDPVTRGAATIALWESMLDGRVPAHEVLEELLRAVAVETDELDLQLMLDDLKVAFWRFTPADERTALSGRLEEVLRAGLARAPGTSAKAAWFSALRHVAMTPASLEWLERVWARKAVIPGLPLSEVDESDLACDLVVRDVPNAPGILALQLQRFQNPDRRDRFAFIMPALSRDVNVREQFFQSLRDPANRTHESWVVDAARYLHHPLRAGTSRILVRPALDLLVEIQRTGDIFFPRRWAEATLWGYQSVRTAADVRTFIDELPANYPPRLRLTLLASADPLFRAARFQQ